VTNPTETRWSSLIDRYRLNQHSDHQKYGLGVKELWQVKPEKFQPQLHAAGEVVPRVARAGDAEVAGGDAHDRARLVIEIPVPRAGGRPLAA
jgi:hypothetical protein